MRQAVHVLAVPTARQGLVEITRYTSVDDVGRCINPLIVDGQTHGAVAQGIGNALYEDFVYDAGGQPLTTTFMDYIIPGTMEVPPVDVVHLETPPAVSVTGFKGMAEGGTIGSTSAVANAATTTSSALGTVRGRPFSSPKTTATSPRRAAFSRSSAAATCTSWPGIRASSEIR